MQSFFIKRRQTWQVVAVARDRETMVWRLSPAPRSALLCCLKRVLAKARMGKRRQRMGDVAVPATPTLGEH